MQTAGIENKGTDHFPWALQSWLSMLDANAPSSSNIPSLELPFQRWFKFKEAYAPSLILDCVRRLEVKPTSCLDPFGGCGTTALTCQFLGIVPTLIEVNPFIADLAEAKLAQYDLDSLQKDYLSIRRRHPLIDNPLDYFEDLPSTLCEPGERDRWVFSKEVLSRIVSYRQAISQLANPENARLFRVLLGSILVECSNVLVNGKGRKYRQNWLSRQKGANDVDVLFEKACLTAFADLQKFAHRGRHAYKVLRGSCLEQIDHVGQVDFAIFSPPYPNSFDYTDIYNLELWILGYLKKRSDNTLLRLETLCSHVQIAPVTRTNGVDTPLLNRVLGQLEEKRTSLWDERIPEMVQGYFSDLHLLLMKMRTHVKSGGSVFMVVGDSSYAGVHIPVAEILREISELLNYDTTSVEAIRKMRVSAQQGGQRALDESLIHVTV